MKTAAALLLLLALAPVHAQTPGIDRDGVASLVLSSGAQIIKIKITVVEASAALLGAVWPVPVGLDSNRSDFAGLLAVADKNHVPLKVMPGFTASTISGLADQLDTRTLFQAAASGRQAQKGTIDLHASVWPTIQPDHSISILFDIGSTYVAGPPAKAGGPPQTVSDSVFAVHTFENGDTRLFGRSVHANKTTRYYFATVTVQPPAKV